MKIAATIPNQAKSVILVSGNLPLGGTSTFVLNLCDEFARRRKWQGVAACVRGTGDVGQQIIERGLPMIDPPSLATLHEERMENVYRGCSRHHAMAVVASLGGDAFDFLRSVPEGCARIGMIQSDDEPVYRLVEQYLPWMDAVAGVSREICRKMEARLGKHSVRVFHQPYGVPMPERQRSATLGPLRVLYLGRVIEEQKRVGLMARIMEKTLAAGVEIEWTLIGDGPDLPALRERFANECRVKLLGSIPYCEVPERLPDQDVFFLCSDYEGLPLSLLEAMGAGLVPVVSDLPSGISEVVSDDNGIRIPINHEDAYIDALLALANDRVHLEQLSANAATRVRESHSTAAMAARWESMLDELAGDTTPVWKTGFCAGAVLQLADRWIYHPVFRPFRALGKRLR